MLSWRGLGRNEVCPHQASEHTFTLKACLPEDSIMSLKNLRAIPPHVPNKYLSKKITYLSFMLALTNQVGVRFSDVVARLTPCRNLISSANKQKLDMFSRLCCACMLFWEKSVLFFYVGWSVIAIMEWNILKLRLRCLN